MSDDAPREPAPPTLSWSAKLERLYARVERYVPWLSLGLSVIGVVAVDRSERRGPWIAAAAVLGWIVLVLVSMAHRAGSSEQTGALRKFARFAATSASQSILQLSLFFCAPFYLEASAWTLPQCSFALIFVVAGAITSWDPLLARVLIHPIGGSLLMAFASFVAWNAALPMLGLGQATSLWIAAGGVGVAIPLTRFVQGARSRVLRGALIAGALLPTLLWLGGARAIPPAPLRVVRAGIGTRIVDRELKDGQSHFAHTPGTLYCFTAIRAPHGLHDALEHVWSHDGKVISRIALDLRGGRRQGFRTWSRLRVSPRARGSLRCDVVTGLGQQLGGVEVQIEGAP